MDDPRQRGFSEAIGFSGGFLYGEEALAGVPDMACSKLTDSITHVL
jgi:hypothetical protein